MELMPGSSPLTRGKLDRAAGPGQVVGLIPAHAGKTSCSVEPLGSVGAHPRSRGENGGTRSLRIPARGSSPLTRGKQAGRAHAIRGRRLIPAHAGKTQAYQYQLHESWAHPRSRGENSISCFSSAKLAGSSPLTRGKLREIAQLHEGGGLIPAHAGKTCLPRRRCISHGAHPRSRGENRCSGAGGRSSSGSSPLTRGKRHHPVLQRVRGRLIPAHAGKTFQAELEMIQDRAHPRSRGENLIWSLPDATAGGSSPLTRGKLTLCKLGKPNKGLIPAHAGKTCGRYRP